MAYSGLGAGTQADPYQITTVPQFKEMDNASYAGVYFLLMNDLDFIAEPYVGVDDFYCKFDGGNHKISNLPIRDYVFRPASGSNIVNIEAIFDYDSRYNNMGINPGFIAVHSSFPTLSNFTLSNVRITNKNTRADVRMSFIYNTIIFDSTCQINDVIIEGTFKNLITTFGGNATNIRVFNKEVGRCPVFKTLKGTSTVNGIQYIKPLTISLTDTPMVADSIESGATIRKVYIDAGRITAQYPDLVTKTLTTSGVYTITDVHIKCDYIKSSPTKYAPGAFLLFPTAFTASATRIFSNIWFEGNAENITYPGQQSRLFDVNGRAVNCYYDSEEFVSMTYNLNTINQTKLNDSESLLDASFNGFDFVNFWEIGQSGPVLKGLGNNPFNLPLVAASITGFERLGANSVKINTLLSAGIAFRVEVKDENGNVAYDGAIENNEATVTLSLNEDERYKVSLYFVNGEINEYILENEYFHFYLNAAVNETPISCSQIVSLNNGTNKAIYAHGTVYDGDTIYGTSRNLNTYSENGCIVKAQYDNLSGYELIPITFQDGSKSGDMDSAVKIGEYIYSLVKKASVSGLNYILQYHIPTKEYKIYRHLFSTNSSHGGPSCTDGTYWYVFLGGAYGICKIDVASLNSAQKFNEASAWPISYTAYAFQNYNSGGTASPHTMCVDGSYLYIGFGSPSLAAQYSELEVHKVDKTSMQIVSYAIVPKMTDDMCQTETHLFIGVEVVSSTLSVGRDVGCCAIRKSDMRVTKIPKLHSTDTASTNSYASLIFGNYLIDLKTNKYIYALDISDVDNWSMEENIGARTLKAYKMQDTQGVQLTKPINEIYLHESGVFIGFLWGTISDIAIFDLTGLNYFAAPTVITIDAAIVGDNDVSLAGFITNTGGKTVTAVGIILGQAAGLSDGVDYPVTPVSTEFEKAFNDLEYGTYYFRTYATNAEGTGYGEIKSFALEIPYTEPGQPTNLDKTIQAEITINWTAPIDDGGTPITGYKIERKASDGDWAVIVANTGDTETTYTETLPQGAYQYRVSAITAYTTGQPSAILDVNAVVGGGGMYRIYLGSTEIATIG